MVADINEKQLKFERLAERRTTEAIKKIRLLGNLSNKQNYIYTEQHVKQIIDALDLELRNLKNRFRQDDASEETVFRFKRV